MIDTRLFPPTHRCKYPHMFPQDVAVWERFLTKYGEEYDGFYYDLMCGAPCMQYPHWDNNYRRDAEMLSRLRIDAVGVKGDSFDIIEVKPRLNATAIGQVLTYKLHFIAENNPTKTVRPVIVVGQPDENVMKIAEISGVTVFIV